MSNIFSLISVRDIYITEWSEDIDYNYWSSTDPDYNSSINPLLYQGLKINEITTTGLTWYNINIDEPNLVFNQNVNISNQGVVFINLLTIAIPFNDITKWETLNTLSNNKWIVVFKDTNDYCWVFGYQDGASVDDYNFSSELGGFKLTFNTSSNYNILCSINSDWVNNNIIN